MNSRLLRDALRRLMVAHGTLEPGTRPCGTPLTTTRAHTLLELLSAPHPPTISELAESLGIERTTCSRQCQRMVQDGELRRVAHPTDGRAQRLELTEKGRALAERVDAASVAHFESVLAHIDSSRREDIIDALHTLTHALLTTEK